MIKKAGSVSSVAARSYKLKIWLILKREMKPKTKINKNTFWLLCEIPQRVKHMKNGKTQQKNQFFRKTSNFQTDSFGIQKYSKLVRPMKFELTTSLEKNSRS